jgi:hypothetical protein
LIRFPTLPRVWSARHIARDLRLIHRRQSLGKWTENASLPAVGPITKCKEKGKGLICAGTPPLLSRCTGLMLVRRSARAVEHRSHSKPQLQPNQRRRAGSERTAQALADFPTVDPNRPPTAGDREFAISVLKKFRDPKFNLQDDNGRIHLSGVNGGPPVVMEFVKETRKSSSNVQSETLRQRSRTGDKRRRAACVKNGASKQEVQ